MLALIDYLIRNFALSTTIKDIVSTSAKISPHYLLLQALLKLWELSTEQNIYDAVCPYLKEKCLGKY